MKPDPAALATYTLGVLRARTAYRRNPSTVWCRYHPGCTYPDAKRHTCPKEG